MTAPWEWEEPEPIEASHLVTTRCCVCGASALAAPERARAARCASCLAGQGGMVVSGRRMAYTVPRGYPVHWLAASDRVEREAYPAPEVRSGEQDYAPRYPSPVPKLAQFAAEHGWAVRQGWARGCFAHRGHGRAGPVQDSFSLRFRRPRWGAYAVYVGKGWQSVMLWGDTLPWFPLAGVLDLRAFLAEPAREADWFEAIRERVRLAGQRKKVQTQGRTRKGREGS